LEHAKAQDVLDGTCSDERKLANMTNDDAQLDMPIVAVVVIAVVVEVVVVVAAVAVAVKVMLVKVVVVSIAVVMIAVIHDGNVLVVGVADYLLMLLWMMLVYMFERCLCQLEAAFIRLQPTQLASSKQPGWNKQVLFVVLSIA
jgi:hypothetical protein